MNLTAFKRKEYQNTNKTFFSQNRKPSVNYNAMPFTKH